MKKMIYVVAALTIVMGLWAPVELRAKNRKTKVRASSEYATKGFADIGEFSSLKFAGNFDVNFATSADGTSAVEVMAPENLLEYFEVSNDGGTLSAGLKDVSVSGKYKIKVTVVNPSLNGIEFMGNGDINIIGAFATSEFKLDLTGNIDTSIDNMTVKSLDISMTGSGDVDIERVKMDYFDLKASGSCDMEIFGECDQATFDIMGGCEIDAKDLRTNKMNLTIYGTSFVECNVIELMNGVVGGLSRLQYWGNPDQNFVRKADQATIERFGDR